ncbi:MAG: M64 family metallopeptidase [Prolixibacteraceae bacterium]|jgi:hypothetical protein|nr:M64 family metallopeptidase [Prolixibacteraceae bacterium]
MAKTIKYFLLLVLFAAISARAEVRFHDFFKEQTLRYDFLLGGDYETVEVFPRQMKLEPYWAGSVNHLIDPFDFGNYRVRVFDEAGGRLIFSRGFSPLFMEWQTTEEAKHVRRTFYQSAFVPFPKKKIKLEIEQRQWEGHFKVIHSVIIDPEDYFILRETPKKFQTKKIQGTGKSEECIDLVFLAEGYTVAEMDKFLADADRMTGYLFSVSPFSKHKDEFNIYAVLCPSEESGTDVPGESVYRNTIFNSTFYTFGTPRYLTVGDMETVYDVAALVPWDHIFVLVNTERYGGGGFYNFLSVGSVDNELSGKVFVHEFGHAFAGLGDEYYTSNVAFENFYNLKTEPWEPNLTTLVDFDRKWKKMIEKDTPVPTPRTARYQSTTGVFEGGGYSAKGIYSPMMDCRMKSNDVPYFCPVCSDAIERTIRLHTH